MMKTLFWGLITACLLVLTGCATPQTRARERQSAFASLPQNQQEVALRGEVMEGMNTDAVYVALGKPNRVEKEQYKKTIRETWIYSRFESREIPYWRPVFEHDGRRCYSYCIYDPLYINREVDYFRILFEKGRVVGIKSTETR
jgi:hypothetical protein